MRMGATHFLMKRLPNVATEMALNVLSYNLTRVLNILGLRAIPGSHADVGAGSGFNGDAAGGPRRMEVMRSRVSTQPRSKASV